MIEDKWWKYVAGGETIMNQISNKPTKRQLSLIQDIEDEFGERFTGATKKEASNYIDKWLKYARQDINRSINWDTESRFG